MAVVCLRMAGLYSVHFCFSECSATSVIAYYSCIIQPEKSRIMFFDGVPLSSLFGFAGVIFGSSWGFMRSRQQIVAVQALCTLSFTIHFYLLGAYSGSAMNALTLIQVAIALTGSRGLAARWSYWATMPVMGLLTVMTWNGPSSAAAAAGLSMAALGRWQTDIRNLRLFFVACSLCWFCHNLIVGSPFGMATDCISLATNLYGLWLYRAGAKSSASRLATGPDTDTKAMIEG